MRGLLEDHLPSLFKASWQAAVLALLVFAAQRIFAGRLAPGWRHRLWLLVVIRLALPWTAPSPMSVFNLLTFPGAAGCRLGARTHPQGDPGLGAVSAPSEQTKPDGGAAASGRLGGSRSREAGIVSWVALVWLAGVVAPTLLLLVFQWRFARKIGRRRRSIDAALMNLLEDCKQEMGVRAPVTLVECEEVGSPALFGVVRPKLLLPAELTKSFSPEELRYVVLHELGHVKRKDILLCWLMAGLQVLHWFNPMVWLTFRQMRADRELACDALALSFAREGENQPYGRTIIKRLESFGRSAWAPNLAGIVEAESLLEKYFGRFCGGAARLASLLVGRVFVPNMLPPRASPSALPRAQARTRSIFKTGSENQIKERIGMIAKFKKTNRGLALAVALFAGIGLITLTDAEPGPDPRLAQELIGTWVLSGRPGDVGQPPAAGGRIKMITDSHWSATQFDPRDGSVRFHHGGTYTLKGNEYVESVEYANQNTSERVGKTAKFKITIEGDTLTQIGKGNPWKEVWKRANSLKARKIDSADLQGIWSGQESGSAKGACSLVIQGSTIEFHGADTNEWYKAEFTIYNTKPLQLVTTVTACPFPQYVGLTSYSIYELTDGILTVAGNEPGDPVVPSGFDARSARKIVFKLKPK